MLELIVEDGLAPLVNDLPGCADELAGWNEEVPSREDNLDWEPLDRNDEVSSWDKVPGEDELWPGTEVLEWDEDALSDVAFYALLEIGVTDLPVPNPVPLKLVDVMAPDELFDHMTFCVLEANNPIPWPAPGPVPTPVLISA